MKKKICISVWILFFLFFLVLLVNFISNEVMINKYNKHVYEFNKLWFLGFTQPYISPYNKGNIYFRKGEYELAITQYDEALSKYPTKSAECDIRVNKAQAMLKLVDLTVDTKADVDPIVDQLLLIEDVLLEKGCANADFQSGHDEDAQLLFNEIDEYIDYLASIKDTFSFYGNKYLYDNYGTQLPLSGGDFDFSFIEVADESGTPLSGAEEIISNNAADGFITFNTITYELTDAGTHYYYVHEVQGDNPMIKYAVEEYYIVIELTLSYNKRTLDWTINYYADDPIATQIRFANFIDIPENGGGSGDGNNNNGGSQGNDDGEGGGGSDGDQNQQPNSGDDQQNGADQEMDPIEQQLQEYMNQANEERNDQLNHDQTNDSHYYGDDIW